MLEKDLEKYGITMFIAQFVMSVLKGEDGIGDKFKKYLETWPKTTNNLPILFKDKELEELEGSPFKDHLSNEMIFYNLIY